MQPSAERDRLCEQRVRELDGWREWSREAVAELGDMLIAAGIGPFDSPEELVEEPRLGLAALDELLTHEEQYVGGADNRWVVANLLAFLGECA